MIVSCGHDERGKYRGGTPGDQGGEFVVRSWYDRPWLCVLRHPDREIAATIAKIAIQAAENDCIGYDQAARLGFYNALGPAGWHPERIKKDVSTDCSASTAAIIIAAGHQTGDAMLQTVNPAITTYGMRAELMRVGFQCLTDKRYLRSDHEEIPGDILLNDKHHVAINVSLYKSTGSSNRSNMNQGRTDKAALQPAPLFDRSCAGGIKYRVKASTLSLRIGPGTTWQEIRKIPRGDDVLYFGYHAKEAGRTWFLVSHKGTSGYVASEWLEKA